MNFKFVNDFFLRIKFIRHISIVSVILLMLLMTLMCIGTITSLPEGIKLGPFDVLCNITGVVGVLGKNFQATVIIPIYSFLVISVIDCDNNPMITTRAKSRVSCWNRQIKDCIMISFIITLLVVIFGYFLSGLLLGDFNNYFSSTSGYTYRMVGNTQDFLNASKMFYTPSIFFVISISLFIGLNFLSILIGTLKCFLSNKLIWMIIVIGSVYGTYGGEMRYLVAYTVIHFGKWVNPQVIISGSIFMILITIVFYFIGRYLVVRKDFINK